MKRAFTSVCAVAAVLSVAATGCTQQTGDGPAAATSATAAKNSPERELTDAEDFLIGKAEQLLVKKCMARHGYPYWIDTPLSAEESRASGFVNDDVPWAREHGYGGRIKQKVAASKKADRNLAYRAELPEGKRAQYVATLAGGPESEALTVELPAGRTIESSTGGCEAAAQQELYGDSKTWFRADRIAGNLTPLYVPDLVADKRFTMALKAWSGCMARAGHDYSDPEEIRSDLPELTEGLTIAEAHTTEVKLAVAEATCARESSLARTARELERHYRDKLRGRYGEEMATRSRLQHAALARAKKITGSGS
ncbi:hypothetical protein [Streptomyces sp. LARHCF252]